MPVNHKQTNASKWAKRSLSEAKVQSQPAGYTSRKISLHQNNVLLFGPNVKSSYMTPTEKFFDDRATPWCISSPLNVYSAHCAQSASPGDVLGWPPLRESQSPSMAAEAMHSRYIAEWLHSTNSDQIRAFEMRATQKLAINRLCNQSIKCMKN